MSRKQKIGKNINTPYSHETASLGTGTNKTFALQEISDQMIGFNIKVADSTTYQTGYGATMGINSAGTFIFKNTSSSVVSGAAATLNEVFSISKTGVLNISSLNVGSIAIGGDLNINNYKITNSSDSQFNTQFGTSALASVASGGTNNCAFGYQALNALTTADNCVAIGYCASFFSTSYDNVTVGSYAFRYATSGAWNIAIGSQALQGQSGLSTGSANIGIGYQSGYSYTNGGRNINIGYQAGYTATNVSYCVNIGYQAGYLNTASGQVNVGYQAGYSNIASDTVSIGYQAYRYATDATNSTAVGYQAMQGQSGLSTGIRNSAFGYQAGFSFTSGGYNTNIGSLAGYSALDASACTNIGVDAGYYNISGNHVVNVGYSAGFSNTGDGNIYIGVTAGQYPTSGTYNVGVGWECLKGVSNQSTGSFNTAMGYRAGYLFTTAASNSIYGYSAAPALTTGGSNVMIGASAGTTLASGSNCIYIGASTTASGAGVTYETVIGTGTGKGSNTIYLAANTANTGFYCNALTSASTAYKVMFNTSTYQISYTADTSASVSDGWVDSTSETWTYVSADAPTFVFSVNADVTTKYSAGMKIRYVQSATTKYGIITAVGSYSGGVTNITIYGGGGDAGTYTNATSYTLANSAISSNYYSMVRAPYGFPMSPATWSYIMINAVDYSTTSATYVNSSASLQTNCPIGVWNVDVSFANLLSHASVVDVWGEHALSTSTSSVSNVELLAHSQGLRTSAGFDMVAHVYLTSCISAASKTTYYLIYRSYSGRTTYYKGTTRSTYVNYKCAYL